MSKAKNIIDMCEEEWQVKYARMEPSTDSTLKKYAPGEKKFDVQVYDDPEATKKYGRFMWDQSSKPKKSQKKVTMNGYNWQLQWLPDMTEQKDGGEHLWIRLGDSDDYEDYGDDIQALAGYLQEVGIKEIDRWVEKGFEASGFGGHNYVSLYWGDADANFISELAQREKIQLEKALKG